MAQLAAQNVNGALALAQIIEEAPAKSSTEAGIIGYSSCCAGIPGLVMYARSYFPSLQGQTMAINGINVPNFIFHPTITPLS